MTSAYEPVAPIDVLNHWQARLDATPLEADEWGRLAHVVAYIEGWIFASAYGPTRMTLDKCVDRACRVWGVEKDGPGSAHLVYQKSRNLKHNAPSASGVEDNTRDGPVREAASG